MNNMQRFFNWLTAADEPEAAWLARLTEVTTEQMSVLKADLDWETWAAVEPAPAPKPGVAG